MIVSDDCDDKYIPKFDFEYYICDCGENWDLKDWGKYFDMDKPVVFINTSEMFRKIRDNNNFI